MKPPIYVRPLAAEERAALREGLRSADAFVLRRCQIVLASADRQQVPDLARALSCNRQTVRNAIHAFNDRGLACLTPGSSRPRTIQAAFAGPRAEALRDLLHRSPRDFGRPTSVWTLELAAEVSFAEGLTPTRVSDETIRATLARLGVRWRRAKQSASGGPAPTPRTNEKKVARPADPPRPGPPGLALGL